MTTMLARRFDSLVNFFTGQGVFGRDRELAGCDVVDPPMNTTTLQALINGNDIAYRIVTALPNKALKDGFGLADKDGELEPGDAQEQTAEIMAAFEALEVRGKLLEADAWGRGFGLGGLVLGVEGGGSPHDPLDDDKVTALSWLMVVDRREVVPLSYYADPNDAKFGEVEFYNVVPTGSQGTTLMKLHESRLIRFGGAMTSRRERLTNSGCDYSVLQRMRTVLRQSDANWASVCALMDDMSQGVYKIKGLMDLIAAGNESTMQSRMTLLDMYRSVRRSIVLDADGEDFERKTTPMTGVNEVLEQTWKRVAAAAEMPLTVLMGVSPAGLNATGESDMRLWYDTVRAHQEHVLAPRIERLARLVSQTLGHANADAWKVTWPSLWQMTASEQAAYRLQVAQADKIYIDEGVLLPEEVALSRFASGEDFDGASTAIDADARKASMKQALEDMVNPPPPPPVLMAPVKQGALPAKPAQKMDDKERARPFDRADVGDWDESKHPRAKDGKFGEGEGSGSSPSGLYAGHSAETAKNMNEAENAIVGLKKEKAVCYNKDGQNIAIFQGTKGEVNVPEYALKALKDGTLTHNHPNQKFSSGGVDVYASASLSKTDAMTTIKYDIKEVRAVAATIVDGRQRTVAFIMRRPEGGWPEAHKVADAFDRHRAGAIVRARAAAFATTDKKLMIEHAVSPTHLAWEATSKELGFHYERAFLNDGKKRGS